MESDSGPISITALLAASNQQQTQQPVLTTYQQPPALPPKPPLQNLNIPVQQYQIKQPKHTVHQQQVQVQVQIQQHYQTRPQQHEHNREYIEYFSEHAVPVPVQQEPISIQQNLQQIYQIPQPTQIITQLPSGYHVLSHHNPSISHTQYQPIITHEQTFHNNEQFFQQRVPKNNPIIQQHVGHYRAQSVAPSSSYVPTIMAKPQTPLRNINQSRSIPKTTSRVQKNPEYFVDSNDKLFSKVQQMQSQIDKLSRAIIKKDNQDLYSQLSLNQVIQQKEKILERKNRELEISTKRIKQLIEETQRKDLQIQRLKLQIERANRINNLSVSLSKIDDVQIRNDAEGVLTSAYFKDLIQQPHDSRSGYKSHMIPTRQTSSSRNTHHIPGQLVSPSSIDLRYAKPAGEVIYKPSGQRQYY